MPLTRIYDALFTKKPGPPSVPASVFYSKAGYSVGEISVDLILREDHALQSTVTSHPVEIGSAITDHIRNELRVGSLSCLVSNHSLNLAPDAEIPEAASSARVPNYGDAARPRTPNPSKDTWELFKGIWQRRELVTIVTVLETYEEVAISNVRTSRTGSSGDALEFMLDFRQVRQVSLQEVEITAAVAPRNMSTPLNRKSAVQANTGRAVASQAPTGPGGPFTQYVADNQLIRPI